MKKKQDRGMDFIRGMDFYKFIVFVTLQKQN